LSVATGMANAMKSRGPDSSGVWSDASSGVAFGHRRLAIVDLSEHGHQPMVSATGRYVITFNGEIYNFLSIKKILLEDGVQFRGNSDTEVLLAAVEKWGITKTLTTINGMFAFSLWDMQEKKLCLVRDRMGEKPLYYGFVAGVFAFASEIGALRSIPGFENEISRDSLVLYMRDCNVPAPHSIYSDIFKLQPGSMLALSSEDVRRKSVPEPVVYWSVSNAQAGQVCETSGDDKTTIDQLHHLLRNAVQGQMLSDVPLGAFLSGGIDSSLIVALMQDVSQSPVKTFTIGFDDVGYDESPFAAAIAKHLGTEHSEYRVTAANALGVIPDLPKMYGEPFADSSQIPTFLVCHAAKQAVTVALSGDAGDELFGGYSRYLWTQKIWNSVGSMPFPLRRVIGAGLKTMPISGWDLLGARSGDRAHKLGDKLRYSRIIDDLYLSFMTEWSPDAGLVINHNLSPEFYRDAVPQSDNALERMMQRDMVSYLPNDILTKVDRAAMAVSLETRVPMLDHRVVEFALSLPLHMKIRSGQTKWILKQVLSRYIPKDLLDRPKAGFSLPLGSWLRGPLRDWAEFLLDESRIQQEGYLNADVIRKKWHQHLTGKRDWTAQLWVVLMFQSWLEYQRNLR
jgi:asparagine synthase (glutamine-hydrolysing)